MIRDYEFHHGGALVHLLQASDQLCAISKLPADTNSAYLINQNTAIYIKYSTKRLSPWRFTFHTEHQAEIENIKAKFPRLFILLVCNNDGVVCLSYRELKTILDEQHDPAEWVSAARSKRQMYTVNGSNGSLEFKVGASDFPSKLFL